MPRPTKNRNVPRHLPFVPASSGRCPYCGRFCGVRVNPAMPVVVRRAYARAKWGSMSTCVPGVLAEHERLGASYANVIVEHLKKIGHAAGVVATRELFGELQEAVNRVRAAAALRRARRDQLLAQARDLREQSEKRWGRRA
jgi:hypothetical protein